jgi:hypothetical protein
MQPWTIGTLHELEAAPWFSRVGVKDAETAIVLTSWPEAIEHSRSYEWEFLRTEALNQYRERIAERSKERLSAWNDVLRRVKKLTDPLVERKIAAVVREHNLPEIFAARVRNDISGVCMESEYADVYPPGFFASNAYWYVSGHFPCGWRGEFPPKGQLVIY